MYWPQTKNIWDYSSDDFFYFDVSNLVPTEKTPFECSLDVIRQITEKYPKPYYLMLSGGLDSQALLDVWIASNIEFVPIHFTYNRHWNRADTLNIFDYCKTKNIDLIVKDINVFEFYENELEKYAKEYVCNSPHITVYMKMSDIVQDGTVIFSGNPLTLINPSHNLNNINYTILGLHRYKLRSKRPIVPFFFLESAEQSFSFKEIEALLSVKSAEKLVKNYQEKAVLYMLSGFDVYPTHKLSGFEMYKQYYDQFPKLVTAKDKLNNTKFGKSFRVFDSILRYKLYEINKYSNRMRFLY